MVGLDIRPLEASFVHGRNARRGEVARCLGCPIVFGQDHVRIVLKASDMAAPIATADDRLLKILRAHCEATLKEHGTREPGLLQAVERRIIELLPTGAAKAKVIAVDLGMSDRTLTRKLAMEGTSFDAVLDRLRHQLAVKYVTGSNLSLTQVAFCSATPTSRHSARPSGAGRGNRQATSAATDHQHLARHATSQRDPWRQIIRFCLVSVSGRPLHRANWAGSGLEHGGRA